MDSVGLKVSFIIPLYNGALYILRSLQSLSHQGLPAESYEVVVVDNCSRDDGAAIVSEYASTHANVRLISEPRQGVCYARNTGILNARGEYLLLLDQDDILLPGAIAECVALMDAHQADVLKFGIRFISDKDVDEIRGIESSRCVLEGFRMVTGVDYLVETQLVGMGHSQIGTCLIRRSYRDMCGALFSPQLHYYEDQAFIIMLMVDARRVLISDQPIYCFLSHPDSTSYNPSEQARRYILDGTAPWPLVVWPLLGHAKVRDNASLSRIVTIACHARCYGVLAKMIAMAYPDSAIKACIDSYSAAGIYPYADIPSDSCYYIRSKAHRGLWAICKSPACVRTLAAASRLCRRWRR